VINTTFKQNDCFIEKNGISMVIEIGSDFSIQNESDKAETEKRETGREGRPTKGRLYLVDGTDPWSRYRLPKELSI